MLIRTVRMTFHEDKVEEFLKIFEENKRKIRSFKGCKYLELRQDYHTQNVFLTYSHWVDDQSLNSYRHSTLFENIWSNTKSLFSDRPVAFSSKRVDVVSEV